MSSRQKSKIDGNEVDLLLLCTPPRRGRNASRQGSQAYLPRLRFDLACFHYIRGIWRGGGRGKN